MPTHDIIDNRNQKLVDQIKRILDSSEAAHFAVGYFFLSGFTAIAERLTSIKELRLLIGNTTNRETIEQIAQGYRRLELIEDKIEAQKYPKRSEEKQMASVTAANIRSSIELMDQTDEAETLVKNLVQMIEEKRLHVRVYTKGTLHAKAYIFDYGTIYDNKGRALERQEKGISIVGSSNLTLSGITNNTELYVSIHGTDNHTELPHWFDELWNEAEDFNEALMQEMKQSWTMPVRPYDVYMKTLYSLVKDRLEDTAPIDLIIEDEISKQLADFQKVAVNNAVQNIRDYGGAFVSDVVGLGKSFIGAAIVKRFEQTERARPLIICPAPLIEMWERYNEVYQLNARVLSMGMLKEDDEGEIKTLLNDFKYKDRDFVLIDESHNLRNNNTQRYKVVEVFLGAGKRCCFLTATPRNKTAWDIYHQLKLFHQDDKTDLPIDPPNLKEYFQLIEKGEKKLPELLSHILIRRTRNHILRFYGFDSKNHHQVDPSNFREYLDGTKHAYVIVGGKHRFFPKRELETIEYSIEDTYQGLYQDLRKYMGKSSKNKNVETRNFASLHYARYGLWNYVLKDKQKQEPYNTLQRAGANLRGLMRVLLFKRFESSVYAFQETIKKLLIVHKRFLKALSQGFVPAGEEAQTLLSSDYNQAEEQDLIDALQQVSNKYDLADFNAEILYQHIEHDIKILQNILALVEPISPDKDAKLQTLIKCLSKPTLKSKKQLIFTQYADTAKYLHDNLNPDGKRDDIDVIYSGSSKNKSRVVGRFAPNANKEYKFKPGECELNTLIATDVLAEGLNLQDGDLIINYDLHWNPVKLIQRFGRIDRIGSEKEVIYGYNFLPEIGIERNLGLQQKLKNRIQQIHDTIGEDAAILDKTEQLNEEAMYAIYEQNGKQLSLFDIDDEDNFLDLNEAEEILRKLQKENPGEFERIANLPHGIRTAKFSMQKGTYVFCEASDPNRPDIKGYQQLFLLDDKGEIISRDIPRILGTIKADDTTPTLKLPSSHNSAVMRVKRQFAEEVKHRQAEKELIVRLTQGQRYILRELRIYFKSTTDESVKGQVNILEKAFRLSVNQAVNRELNKLRRDGFTGQELFNQLRQIYRQHNMHEVQDNSLPALSQPIPIVICSQALV